MFSYQKKDSSPNIMIVGALDAVSISDSSSALLTSRKKGVVINKINTTFKRVHNSPRYNSVLQGQKRDLS